MKKVFFKFFCLALLFMVSWGCGYQYHKKDFDRYAHPEVKTIGVLEPDGLSKCLVGGVDIHYYLLGPAVGHLAAEADAQSKTNQFNRLLRERNFGGAKELLETLTAELQNIGYSVKILKVQRKRIEFFEKYDALEQADAYLDLIFPLTWYHSSGPISTTSKRSPENRLYHPELLCHVRLVKPGHKVIYDNRISFGLMFAKLSQINIPVDQQYFFDTFDALMNDPDRAIEGLKTGASLIVKRIAQDLSVQGK